MKKKILIAVDNSIHSKNAVRYAVQASSFINDLNYTILNVQPVISQFLTEEAKKSVKARSSLEKFNKKQAEISLSLLESYKTQMINTKIDSKCIEIKTLSRRTGLAKDILEHAQENRYDAIIVGRRGLSRIQEVFMGSLTTSLLEHSHNIPVWVVDGDITSPKIMIAVDGSESALRAVDHLSFMVGKNSNISITLFHVIPNIKDYCPIDFDDKTGELEDIIIQGDKKCVENFFVHAIRKFKDAGIMENQIQIKEEHGSGNVGKMITDEAKKGNYGTVVVGRSGMNNSFFIGSVSKYVIDKASGFAVWLVS